MSIQESGEMYLETILILQQKRGYVRSMDIAEFMNFSKPSVSRAVKILREDGYINMASNGLITLTDHGREVASKIYDRHVFLSQFLMHLGVDEETAVRDACKMEHDISDVSFEALKRHVQSVCPAQKR